ncbi:MAG: L,D-transpeptidase family protein [Bdellovibrionia bacterium]
MSTKLKSVALALALTVVAACAKKSEFVPPVDVNSPAMTGNAKDEAKVVTEKKADLKDGEVLYVQTDDLYVRAEPSRTAEILGKLKLNDQVRKLGTSAAGSEFVQVEVVKSKARIKQSVAYYVGFRYLDKTPQSEEDTTVAPTKPGQKNDDSLFVIQNVATEKLRVYQKTCTGESCKNKMILETEIVVGEANNDTHTVLGSFRIAKWVKFYQDGAGLYPSWYDPNYPAMPERGKGFGAWRDEKVLPNGKGAMRGAFGWYTALVGPNSHNQWTHGTIGWGVDKDKYIRLPRKWYVNLFADPRSHGCTRTDNESIAYLRHLLPVGTPIFKIYTNEALYDSNLKDYPKASKPWNYIMTKNGVRVDGQKADRDEVLKTGTPQNQWLEEGTYQAKQYPETRKLSDRYKAGKENISGTFYVDVGLLDGYSHPKTLDIGGSKEPLPAYLLYKLGAPVKEDKAALEQAKKDAEKKAKDEEKARKEAEKKAKKDASV